MNTVKLTDGNEVLEGFLLITLESINALLRDGLRGLQAGFDLLMLAKNPDHKIADTEKKLLIELALMQPDGSLHEDIKSVARCAYEIDGWDVRQINPIVE